MPVRSFEHSNGEAAQSPYMCSEEVVTIRDSDEDTAPNVSSAGAKRGSMGFQQAELFLDEARADPPGLHFLPEFLSDAEAHEWLALIGELTHVEARFKE
jgi:hypothetical protein